MIKWFFIYKWLELKEYFERNWIPISIIGAIIVSVLVWFMILIQTNQTMYQAVLLSMVLGVFTTLMLGLCFKFVTWVIGVVKDNIEKAREAISYDVSKLECCNCVDGKIEILPPLRSSQRPRFKCLDCGFVSDICNADRRRDDNNK